MANKKEKVVVEEVVAPVSEGPVQPDINNPEHGNKTWAELQEEK